MPEIRLRGARIYYEDSGGDGPPILWSHGLLWSCRLFDPQVAHLRDRYRCVAYDHRGQGRSERRRGFDVGMEALTEDAAALIEALDLGPCHIAGLSMGGFVALRLAARRPELLRSAIIMASSSQAEPEENVPKYRKLNLVARLGGLSLVAGKVMPIMFGDSFLKDPTRAEERAFWEGQLRANDRSIHRAVRGVIERDAICEELGAISLPTLIMVGDEDKATVPAKAAHLAESIPGARLVTIPRAGHSLSVEEPAAVNAALDTFLASLEA